MTKNKSPSGNKPQKKVVNRCLSCKKLKIKCDEATPKCEYCEYTNRECIYPDVSKKKTRVKNPQSVIIKTIEIIEDLNSSPADLWISQMGLNSTSCQLGVSFFELRLLHYFQAHYVKVNEGNPLDRVWHIEVPKLWHQSDIVRQSIFALSAMHLWALCDLTTLMQEDILDSRSKRMSFLSDVNHEELSLHPNDLRIYLLNKTSEYFTNCLNRTNSMMGAIISQEYVVTTVFQAAEIVISGILLFSFLALQPNGLVPLLSYNEDTPDVISMCKGMKISMAYAFPLLFNTSYHGLFHRNELLDPPTITEKDRYPMVEYLRDKLDEIIQNDGMDDEQIKLFKRSIDLIEIVFYRTIESSCPLPIFKWIFLVEVEFYDVIKKDMNSFGLKLLFLYTCLCVICKFRIDKTSNIWLDFIEWYKNYNFTTYGKWNDSFDQEMYELVIIKNFEIPQDSYYLLQTFVPLMYL